MSGSLLTQSSQLLVAPVDDSSVTPDPSATPDPTATPDPSATVPDAQVMNVSGNDPQGQGNPMNLGSDSGSSTVTLNLTDQPTVSLNSTGDTTVVANVSGPVAYVDLNSSDGGNYTFNLSTDSSVQSVSIDLLKSVLGFNGGMAFLNTGNVNLHDSTLNVGTDLEGTGKILVEADHGVSRAEFFKSVSTGQSIDVQGSSDAQLAANVKVDDPSSFGASVQLDFGKLTLANITADSYDLKNDILSLYQNGTVVDTVSLTQGGTQTDAPLHVYATNTGVLIDNSGLGGTNGVALPLHG